MKRLASSPRFLFYTCLTTAHLVLTALAWRAFEDLRYTSDGISYFLGLRNFVNGIGAWGLYEGPTFEYIFGNHVYIILHFFGPLVKIWNSPLTLLLICGLAHSGAAAVLFEWALRKANARLALALGAFYFVHPMAIHGFDAGGYLFQPDLLLPLFLFAMAWSFSSGAFGWTALWGVLGMLCKEEYIVTLPCFATLLFISKNHHLSFKNVLKVYGPIFLAGGVSVLTRHHFVGVNTYTPVDLHVHWRSLGEWDPWRGFINLSYRTLLPFLVAGLLIAWKEKEARIKALLLLGAALLLFLGRLVGQLLIYGRTEELYWSNSALVPIVIVGFVFSYKVLRDNRLKTWLTAVVAVFTMNNALRLKTAHVIQRRDACALPQSERRQELRKIAALLPDPQGVEAVASPNFIFLDFIEKRSFVELRFFHMYLNERAHDKLKEIHYLLLSKDPEGGFEKYAPVLPAYFAKLYESDRYALYKNEQARVVIP